MRGDRVEGSRLVVEDGGGSEGWLFAELNVVGNG